MHIKFVARCNRSSQKKERRNGVRKVWFLFYYAKHAGLEGRRTLRAAEYPFLVVQTKTNTDKSIINARLHTKAAQREAQRDEHGDGEKKC